MSALAPTWSLVEQLVGRRLSEAEQAIDVLKLDQALNTAKDDLHAAILNEQKRAVRRALDLPWLQCTLNLTNPMLAPLERLFQLGRREGLEELRRLGYQDARRAYVAEPKEPRPELAHLADYLRQGLRAIGIRIDLERGQLEADLTGVVTSALIDALYQVPGARDVASRVVSSALTAGLSATFEENQHLVTGWEYTAILDGGTCEVCAPLDGTTYATLDELFVVLPNFGPNPECLGGGRCRCRAVPSPA